MKPYPFQASVIVPTRGGAARLPRLLDDLERQTNRNFEVIVVVDGDIDDTETVVRSYRDLVSYPLNSIVFPENRGRVSALNAGAESARGRILIRSDDDLGLQPGHVQGHIDRHANGDRGVIGLCRNVFDETDYAWAYGRETDLKFRREALASAPERHWRYWGANVSVPKILHDRIDGYDPRYRHYGWEDVDFGYRLHTAGILVEIAPELEADHHGPGNLEGRALRALFSGAARARFVGLHGDKPLGPAARPGGAWGLVVRTVAAGISEPRISTIARWLDANARRLPHKFAQKTAALLVEASGFAGASRGVRCEKV